GVTNFSSEELRRIKGMQSRQVMKLLPHGEEEVIHRDYFVLADQEARESGNGREIPGLNG
ncbi:MAG: hypothetical protein AABZ63_07055, partial [Actinomycetota bacterium]